MTMLSEAELVAVLARIFPIAGKRHTVDLVENGISWPNGDLVATLRLVIWEDGVVRDVKEQEVPLLPRRHRDARGVAMLEISAERATTLDVEDVETLLPFDLFAPALLDTPLAVEAFRRVLDDPRAGLIFERRGDDAALMATIDPATRPAIPVLRDPAIEAQILERLDDPAGYAVYGDWLAERGDPRGELIALQIALATTPDDAMAARVAQLLAEYQWEWLGYLAWSTEFELELAWRYGFVKRVRLGSKDERTYRDTNAELRDLARLPIMAFVETLHIEPKEVWFDDVFATLGEVSLPAATRHLAIATPEYERMGSLYPAYRGLPRLETLRLESRAFELGSIDLPALRGLDLVTRGLTRDNLESLREAAWPKLERLVLWLGDAGTDDCDVELADLDWILAGDGLPALRYLGLCGRGDTSPLLERLVDAPIVKRLDTLDLAGTYLDDTDVRLFETTPAFAKLRRLHLPPLYGRDVTSLAPNVICDERFVPVYE